MKKKKLKTHKYKMSEAAHFRKRENLRFFIGVNEKLRTDSRKLSLVILSAVMKASKETNTLNTFTTRTRSRSPTRTRNQQQTRT